MRDLKGEDETFTHQPALSMPCESLLGFENPHESITEYSSTAFWFEPYVL